MIALAGLALAGDLVGDVVGAEGGGVAEVIVVAYDLRLNYGDDTTGEGGNFRIAGLPAGRYRVRALAPDEDPHVDRFAGDTWDFCSSPLLTVEDTGDTSAGTVTLPLGGSLSGRVTDAAGAPVAGGYVVGVGASERTALVSRIVTTDDDGRYVVPGLDADPGEPEPYLLYFAPEGWPGQFLGPAYEEEDATALEVALGEPTAAPDAALLDGVSLAGTLTDDAGEPVAGAVVYAYASGQVLDTLSDADGAYVADGLPPGDALVWASADGLATTYWPGADRPTDDRVDANEEGLLVEGVDLAMPVESRLTLDFAGDGDLSEVSVLLYNTDYTVGRGGGLNADGVFRIDGLHDGDYTLYVFGDDGGFVRDWLRDDAGNIATVRVAGDTVVERTLSPGGRLEGRVVDDTGAPVYGAAVYAFATESDESSSTTTDHDGRWAIGGLFEGRWTVRASYVHYCPSDPGYVTKWWDDALVEEAAGYRDVDLGETVDGVDFTLPRDDDHDTMGDAWEAEHGLDPERDDAADDADGDGYTNVEEWLAGTDPTDVTVEEKCGCGGGKAAWLLPVALLQARRRRSAHTGAPRAIALRW
ncbi:MAG: carboxypeptidase regulatory-like domain-containing protein [Myxococcota bacterium]